MKIPKWAQFQASLSDHPLVLTDGILRYEPNRLVQWLRDHVDLNDMWIAFERGAFPQEEFMQFYRDIGHTLAGSEEIWGDVLDELQYPIEESNT